MYLISQLFKAQGTIQTFFWYIIKSNSDGWVLVKQKGIYRELNTYNVVNTYLNL